MKTTVNLRGYVRIKDFGENVDGDIFPYVAKLENNIFIVNNHGNILVVDEQYCKFL